MSTTARIALCVLAALSTGCSHRLIDQTEEKPTSEQIAVHVPARVRCAAFRAGSKLVVTGETTTKLPSDGAVNAEPFARQVEESGIFDAVDTNDPDLEVSLTTRVVSPPSVQSGVTLAIMFFSFFGVGLPFCPIYIEQGPCVLEYSLDAKTRTGTLLTHHSLRAKLAYETQAWAGGGVSSLVALDEGISMTEHDAVKRLLQKLAHDEAGLEKIRRVSEEMARAATLKPPEPPPGSGPGSVTLGVGVDEDAGEGRGVAVVSVTPGGPAERAGVESGDIVQRIDGKPTTDLKSLHRAVAAAPRRAGVAVLRRGRPIELVVSLPGRPVEPAPLAPAPAQAEAAPVGTGNTYVLAIGVNEYQDPRIPKLRFAEQDARGIYGFYATSRRSPTTSDRVVLLTGKDATRNGILKAMREQLERKATRPEDTVVFYFGGHGFSDADDTYLAAWDTQIDSLPETGLSSATLREYWTKIRAGRKVIIMDACHAGGIEGSRGTRGVGGVKIGDEATPGAATSLVIAATGPNELSTEDTSLGHGVFTRVLLNGLAGEADEDKDGHVTGDELGRYLVREVPSIARGFGGNQTPVITQKAGGTAILLTR
jgi:hypothetical protein